ncbi:GumC family protein [Winogradskyella alexanderae]|uniref:non-specific protein-tyrosine kinase n=1 Tax=Winogradskyella alexanderae TaxID=2877123 RepID=A0ABS7XUT7_9FLAO|nr:tyrosine-protein kinase family protein [Winogradskyella alexanderae]MCA0132682.1 polysaccharide biosynthesis tyrosine autokinase [Winogradskyella alexanderae]
MASNSNNSDIRQLIESYLNEWKLILLCLIVAVSLAYTYLRYANNEYKATATIKIQEENESKKLPSIGEITNNGFFSQGADKIKDEIEIIKSRTIIENVVKNLNLNIVCFAEGKIKELEIYRNPPLKLSFFESDSIISRKKGDLYLKVKSSSEFLLFENEDKSLMSERDESKGKLHAFGEKIESIIGDVTITPNTGKNAPIVGGSYKLSLIPVSSIVSSYQRKINVTTDKGSSIIKLELNDSNSFKAMDILDELIKEYNKDVLADKEAVVRITSEFINNRLEKVSEELGEVETKAELVQKQNSLVALNSQADINLQSKKQIENQIANTATNIQMITYLQEEISDDSKISDMLPANVGIGDANTALIIKSHNDLVGERDRILKNSTEKNPVVVQLNNQIQALKENLENSLASIKKTSELTLENLNSESERISGQLYVAPSKARQLRGINRQQSIKESLYLYLLEKREESAITLGMYTSSAKLIDSAHSSHKPVAPNRMMIYLASFLFGLGIPVGFLYIKDIIDNKIYSKDELTNLLNIPYIGDIPKSSKKEKLIKKVDYSPKAEAFRIVRSNIDFILKNIDNRAKKLFVTSTKAQEGKSHTSTNLASSISFSKHKVLLIEGDIRVPKILKYLEVEKSHGKGLSDYIADKTLKLEDVIVHHPSNEYLDILPSGTIPPNPSELLMSKRFNEIITYAEKNYNYVIVDTSAVGLVSDTLLISDLADLFIYVVSADNVDKRQLVHVAQPLYDEKRLPNLTLLLNGVKKGKKGYGYGYGYGSSPNKKKKWYNFFRA